MRPNLTRMIIREGIWDIIYALKWVQDEIENFGGDKDSVTIAGESAGSVMVSLLSVTEFARGYYKRHIMESASAMWLLMDDENSVIKRSFAVAEKVGCANESINLEDHSDVVEACMRGIDALTIIKAEGSLNPGSASSYLPRWGDQLFPRNPRQVMLEGASQVQELFIGNSGMEGAFKIPTSNPDIFGFFGEKDASITREEGIELLLKGFPTFQDKDKLVEHYFPSENDDGERSRQYEYAVADALGDYVLVCPTVYYAAIHAQYGKSVYYYDFQHRPQNSVWADWMGTTHFDEVDFVFGGPFKSPSQYPTEERALSKLMIEHWTNFVKYGKPKDDWPVYGEKFEMEVYTVGDATLGHGPRTNSCMFWQPYFDPDDKLEFLLSY
ncbi:Acetylcholinesterase-1 [Araneus ventricosus]|uniref:Carboxylic ester hydrolase n=1 Tax=Araneus ventricosus TaxID=182803 RepID=A0A4Y2UCE3_ARAVE|nr:Acetylcholinesterase-1 [Araneus ventricosus]GBO09673.1 Acetylcholinesterase-1 [Araneus ventricosus]